MMTGHVIVYVRMGTQQIRIARPSRSRVGMDERSDRLQDHDKPQHQHVEKSVRHGREQCVENSRPGIGHVNPLGPTHILPADS
jgi:16S rRNA U1498 N3-methylase RsmE